MDNISLRYEILEPILGNGKTSGYDTRYNCFFCGNRNNKLYVITDDESPKPLGSYHCWVCESTGSLTRLVSELYSVNYAKANEMLSDIGIDSNGSTTIQDYKRDYVTTELTREESLYLMLRKHKVNGKTEDDVEEKHVPFPTNMKPLKDNLNLKETFKFQEYLMGRGITLEQIIKHDIQYVSQGVVRKRDLEEGEDAYMNISDSIIFLTHDENNNPTYWNTRSLDKNAFVKSINAPARKDEFGKHNSVFNLNNASKYDNIVIVEGVFNALTIGDNAVATFGKKITEEQVDMILELSYDKEVNYYVFLDDDAREESIKLAERLSKSAKNVFIVDNPYGDKDANDLGHDISVQLIRNARRYDKSYGLKYLLS